MRWCLLYGGRRAAASPAPTASCVWGVFGCVLVLFGARREEGRGKPGPYSELCLVVFWFVFGVRFEEGRGKPGSYGELCLVLM